VVFENVEALAAEHADLERQLADPAIHSDQNRARALGRRYAELTPIVETHRAWLTTQDDIATARELARNL